MGFRAFLVGYESRGGGAVILTGDRCDQLHSSRRSKFRRGNPPTENLGR